MKPVLNPAGHEFAGSQVRQDAECRCTAPFTQFLYELTVPHADPPRTEKCFLPLRCVRCERKGLHAKATSQPPLTIVR